MTHLTQGEWDAGGLNINQRWLLVHRRILLGVAAASFIIEALTALLLSGTGVYAADSWSYAVSYILLPTGCNALLLAAAYFFTRGGRALRPSAPYLISLCLTGVCWVLYTAHHFFSSLYLPFLASVVLTTIYGRYSLTTVTYLSSLAGMIVGRLAHIGGTAQNAALSKPEVLVDYLFALLMLTGLYIVSLVLIRFEKQKRLEEVEKERKRLELQREVLLDPLTGLWNRKALHGALTSRMESQTLFTFVMIDLNGFKKLNDTYGHIAGDSYLRLFASILSSRDGYAAFRYGGDEFCMLTQQEPPQVWAACEQIQREYGRLSARTKTGVRASASFGLARSMPGMSIEQIIQAADAALYRAKCCENGIYLAETAP